MTQPTSLIREADVPEGPWLLVAREAAAGRLAMGVVLLAFALGVPVAVLAGGFVRLSWDWSIGGIFSGVLAAGVGLMALLMVLVCLIGGLAFFTSGLAAWRPSNWALRANADALYVKLRSFEDFRLPPDDAVVAVFPRRDVQWVQTLDRKARTLRRDDGPGARDDVVVAHGYLCIRLFDHDLSALKKRLEAERRLYGPTWLPGVRTKGKGAAITVVDGDGDEVRIHWKTNRVRLRPRLEEAVSLLSQRYRVGSDLSDAQKEIRALSRAQQEQRLIDLASQGNTIDAIKLIRDLYGYDLTQAKRFLDELTEGTDRTDGP